MNSMMELQNWELKLCCVLQCAVRSAKDRLAAFTSDERGDTNFISIIVVLGIALVVAGVFMTFKDTIIATAQDIIESFSIH
jgi:hypothetical protein